MRGAIWRKRNKKEEERPENKIISYSSKVKVISFLHGTHTDLNWGRIWYLSCSPKRDRKFNGPSLQIRIGRLHLFFGSAVHSVRKFLRP